MNNNCVNCDNVLHGAYCSHCGQKHREEERFTVKQILREVLVNITNLERGLWFTIQRLFTAPHQVLSDYLAGKTRPYFNPFRFALLMAGLSALVALSFGFFDAQNETMNKMMYGEMDEEQRAQQQQIMDFMKKMTHIIPLLLIPFISLASRRVFRRPALNYAEHLIINTFLFAQLSVIGLFVQFLYIYDASMIIWSIPISLALGVVYYTYALKPFFGYRLVSTFFRSVGAYIGGFLLFLVFSGLIGFVVGLTAAILR